jgi:parallel beta-helix repeat protein
VENSNNTEIIDNLVLGTGDHGIYVYGSSYDRVHNTNISGNLVAGTGLDFLFDGWWWDGGIGGIGDIGEPSGVMMMVEGPGEGYFFGDGDGIRVENADYTNIDDNLVMVTAGDGIHVHGGSFVNIVDNQVGLTGNDGIHVEGGCYYGPVPAGKGDYGYEPEEGYRDFVNVEDNQVILTGGEGIEVKDRGFTRIVGNDVFATGIGFYGLFTGDQEFIFDINFEEPELYGEPGLTAQHYDDEYQSLVEGLIGFEWGNGDGIKVSNIHGYMPEGPQYPEYEGEGGIQLQVHGPGYYELPYDMNGYDVVIQNNNVSWTGGHGISVYDSGPAHIDNNIVARTGVDATIWEFSFNPEILEDLLFSFRGFGDFEMPDYDELGDMIYEGAGWVKETLNGINIAGGLKSLVPFPDYLEQSSHDGIHVEHTDDTVISGNSVNHAGRNGIYVNPSNNVTVTGNTVNNSGLDGIQINGGTGHDIIGNTVRDSGRNGITLSGVNTVNVDYNILQGSGQSGIEISSSDMIGLLSNRIADSGMYGILARGAGNGYIVLAGNDVYSPEGSVGARFESGLIDMTSADGNSFSGGLHGLQFYLSNQSDPLSLRLAGNTLGYTEFQDIEQYYVELRNGALFNPGQPTVINALNVSFDGFVPADSPFGPGILTLAQFNMLENKIYHFLDKNTLGLIFFGLVPTVDQEDIFRGVDPFAAIASAPSVTLLGMPAITGDQAALLNALAPAAGGEEGGEGTTAEQLAAMEPAAGGAETACWGDAIAGAGGGQVVNFNFGTSQEEILAAQAGCQNNF